MSQSESEKVPFSKSCDMKTMKEYEAEMKNLQENI